jgi:ribosomal protein L21E
MGRLGLFLERRGRGYVVQVMFGNKAKKLSLLPDHLKPFPVR